MLHKFALTLIVVSIIFFIAPRNIYASFRFVSWADTKSGTDHLTALSQQVAALNPAFTVYPGDVCDAGPNATCFPVWQTAINGGTNNNHMFDKTFATRGNHDDSKSFWVSHFAVTDIASNVSVTHLTQQDTNVTYSFDYQNAHFIGVDLPGGDSKDLTTTQINWIDEDLTAAETRPGIDHAFLFFHGAIYYADGHTNSTAPEALITVLNKHPIVSATFHGHEHLIAYTHMDRTRRSTITHPFEQFVTGAAGAPLYSCVSGRSDFCQSTYSFATIDVNGLDFTVKLYQLGSTTPLKTYTFTKTASAPPPTPTPTPPPLPSPTPGGADIQPNFPIRAMFYYPWFPESWTQNGIFPFTKYHPTLGYYDSSDPQVIANHLQTFQYAHATVGISSWWGQGHYTDTKFPLLLRGADNSSFRWSLYYEPESLGDPSVSQLQSDLTYIRDHYGSDRNYLRINGRFVVFVYADGSDGCSMVDRWYQANSGIDAYLVLKVFAGYKTCANQPDGWHQYAPAVAADSQTGFSYSISPGFDKYGDSTRLSRDLNRWYTNVASMVASNAPFQLITTFNEWGEGTAVESATEWSSPSGYGAYLDALHANGVPPDTNTGDYNQDGVIDFLDQLTLIQDFNQTLNNQLIDIFSYNHLLQLFAL